MLRIRDYYDYSALQEDILDLKFRFQNLFDSRLFEVNTIGQTALNKNLYCLKLGTGSVKITINATHHALEWITSVIIMKFIEDICQNSTIFGFNILDILENHSIYFVPMVNPDGVEMVTHQKAKYKNWQANFYGVDINHNYDAGFWKYKEIEKSLGITGPCSTKYSGPFPESELETRAMTNFTESLDFARVMALHSQGEEIYYSYNKIIPTGTLELAHKMSDISGYKLLTPVSAAAFGGYKDWFIKKFNRPGFTIEVGSGVNPLPMSQFDQIYIKTAKIILTFINRLHTNLS